MAPLVSSSDIICVSTNVLVFVVVQCLFFYFLASKQFDDLVKDKLKMLEPFLRQDRLGKQVICNKLSLMTNRVRDWEEIDAPPLNANIMSVQDRGGVKFMDDDTYLQYEDMSGMKRWCRPLFTRDLIKEQNLHRNLENRKCLLTWASPFLVVMSAVLVVSVALALKNKTWKFQHTLGLITVIFCFVTEVIYFFSVFKSYQVLGDWDAIEQTIEHVLPNRKSVNEDISYITGIRERLQPELSAGVNSFSTFFDPDLSTP